MSTTLAIVLAALFAGFGGAKVAAVPAMQGAAEHLGYTSEQYRLIGLLEIAAAVGAVVGLQVPVIGMAAAAGLILLMLGAAGAHIKNHDPAARVVVPILLAAISAAYLFAVH